jgi:hypothetical protein
MSSDDDGATASTSQPVTATSVQPAGIALGVKAYEVKGVKYADLAWSGATSANVDGYRHVLERAMPRWRANGMPRRDALAPGTGARIIRPYH